LAESYIKTKGKCKQFFFVLCFIQCVTRIWWCCLKVRVDW